jgi:hypothetical protein
MATVKMKKGELTVNINDSPESVAHAYTLGFVPVDETADTALKAGVNNEPSTGEHPRRGRPPKNESGDKPDAGNGDTAEEPTGV